MQNLQSHALTHLVKKKFLTGYSEEVRYRFDKLELWQELQDQNCDELTIYKAIKVSRSTLFRWKSLYEKEGLSGLESLSKKPHKMRDPIKQKHIYEYVLHKRKKYPLFGKEKIRIMLQEELGVYSTASTIGRVINKLIRQRIIQYIQLFVLPSRSPKLNGCV